MKANLTIALRCRLATALALDLWKEIVGARILRRPIAPSANASLWITVRDVREFLGGLPRPDRAEAIEDMRSAMQAFRKLSNSQLFPR